MILFLSLWLVIGILILLNMNIIALDSDFDGYNDDIDLFPKDPHEWYDTDNDGYGDNSDDFPHNSGLHKKCQVSCLMNKKLNSEETYYPPNCDCFEVSNQCKYLVIEWHLHKNMNGLQEISADEEEKIYVEINYPSLSLRRDYGFFTAQDISHSFYCPICNKYDAGEWDIHFYNGLEHTEVLMDCEIYRAL